jgi:hypothetical protein
VSWARPRFEPSGRTSLLWYVLFGAFDDHTTIDEVVPRDIDLRFHPRGTAAFDGWLEPPLGDLLELHPDGIGDLVRSASSAISILGEVEDKGDLETLRTTIRLVTALLPVGGQAVLDPQALRWRSPREWYELFPAGATFDWRDHVVILKSDDWLHTRGLRKFARADLSLRRVPPGRDDAAAELIERLLLRQIEGALPDPERFADLLPRGVRLVPKLTEKDLEDEAFDNVRLEVEGFR